MNLEEKINIIIGDAVEILPTLNEKYDAIFIDAAKGKYPFFLKEGFMIFGYLAVIFFTVAILIINKKKGSVRNSD